MCAEGCTEGGGETQTYTHGRRRSSRGEIAVGKVVWAQLDCAAKKKRGPLRTKGLFSFSIPPCSAALAFWKEDLLFTLCILYKAAYLEKKVVFFKVVL